MSDDRSSYGLAVSLLGAIVLVVSVSLPWYAISLTARGASYIQAVGDQFAARYGNAALQSSFAGLHTSLAALAGHHLATVDAHQAHATVDVVLLVLGGVAILLVLRSLLDANLAAPDLGTEPLAVLGALAALLAVYALLRPPAAAGVAHGLFATSLREGPWLALLGALAMVVGGLSPRRLGHRRDDTPSRARANDDVWHGLSGWTPSA
jgi:hypothetical protein